LFPILRFFTSNPFFDPLGWRLDFHPIGNLVTGYKRKGRNAGHNLTKQKPVVELLPTGKLFVSKFIRIAVAIIFSKYR
jgi:hypothetical protein